MLPPGKELERLTREMLAFNWSVTSGEQLLDYVKADLVASRREFGKARRLVVECKDYGKPLTQQEVDAIYHRYAAVINASATDELLLVTRNGVSAGAAARIEITPRFSHQTLSELERTIMDFDAYLPYVIDAFERRADGLPHYYIELTTTAGTRLVDHAEQWLGEPGNQPLAVVASYGLGKSSFASRWAASLADRALNDVVARIPILIPLGSVAAEQAIEGLLGHALTSVGGVGRYSWPAFERLNRAGRFVVLLDGFDEMRFSISASSLRHNFAEISKLVVGDAKVVVLGRPTAFVSDAEHLQVLRATRKIGTDTTPLAGQTTFTETDIRSLTPPEIDDLIARYMTWLATAGETDGDTDLATRIEQVRTAARERFSDLASRPVQLKMLIEVLPHWSGPLDALDALSLYDTFINLVIERDTDKRAKERFPVIVRRRFAGDLAWWLWHSNTEPRVEPENIPSEIISGYTRDGDEPENVLRELVSGCFLERRLGGMLVFPHRSFQEFLVAERVCVRAREIKTDQEIVNLLPTVSDGVADFGVGLLDNTGQSALLGALKPYRGALSHAIARMCAADPDRVVYQLISEDSQLDDSLRLCPWWPALLFLTGSDAPPQGAIDHLHYRSKNLRLATPSDVRYAALLLYCALALGDDDITRRFLRTLLEARQIWPGDGPVLPGDRRLPDHKRTSAGSVTGRAPVERVIEPMREVVRTTTVRGKVVEFDRVDRVFAKFLQAYCVITDAPAVSVRPVNANRQIISSITEIRGPARNASATHETVEA